MRRPEFPERLIPASLGLVLLAVGSGFGPGMARAATGPTAVVSGELMDPSGSRPLPGTEVWLGPGQRSATDAAGRFHFSGVTTAVYRLIVPGACNLVPLRVEVRPGEDLELRAAADFACPDGQRLWDPDSLPPSFAREPLRTILATSRPHFMLDGTAPAWQMMDAGQEGPVVIGVPARPGAPARTVADTVAGPAWITLRERDPDSSHSRQFTLLADGTLGVALIAESPQAPILRRKLCARCVSDFFSELASLDLAGGSADFCREKGGRSVTIAGVVGGRTFMIHTAGLRLAPVEAVRTRLLDLGGLPGYVDPVARARFTPQLSFEVPEFVGQGERFTVRARVAVEEGVFLSGAALWLEVARAEPVAGDRGASGSLAAGQPLVIEADFLVPVEPTGPGPATTLRAELFFAAENAVPEDPSLERPSRVIRIRAR